MTSHNIEVGWPMARPRVDRFTWSGHQGSYALARDPWGRVKGNSQGFIIIPCHGRCFAYNCITASHNLLALGHGQL